MDFILSFILGTIILFYLLGALGRILLQWLIKRNGNIFSQFTTNSNSSQNYSSNSQRQYQSNNRHEGDVFISKKGKNNKVVREDIGDYVEFEEIKNE